MVSGIGADDSPASGDVATMAESDFLSLVNSTAPPGIALVRARCTAASRERQEVVVSCEFDDSFTNVTGVVCGGFVAHILDHAATLASTLMSGKICPSIEMKTNFIAPASPGSHVAVGKVVHIGKSLAFTSATLMDANSRLIATATVTSTLIAMRNLHDRSTANKQSGVGGGPEGSSATG